MSSIDALPFPFFAPSPLDTLIFALEQYVGDVEVPDVSLLWPAGGSPTLHRSVSSASKRASRDARPFRPVSSKKRLLPRDDSDGGALSSESSPVPPCPPVVSRPTHVKIQKCGTSGGSPLSPRASRSNPREDTPEPAPPKRKRCLTDAEAAHKVLTVVRDTQDPRGEAFLAFVDSIFHASPKNTTACDGEPNILAKFGARSKYVLRKLAFSLVPNVKEARIAYIRTTMCLADVKTEENQVTKQEAYDIIRAAYRLDPVNIRIPELHSRVQTAQATTEP